jgi:hypothetical protein
MSNERQAVDLRLLAAVEILKAAGSLASCCCTETHFLLLTLALLLLFIIHPKVNL